MPTGFASVSSAFRQIRHAVLQVEEEIFVLHELTKPKAIMDYNTGSMQHAAAAAMQPPEQETT
jgi:molybdopterin biosynthesis enzyme